MSNQAASKMVNANKRIVDTKLDRATPGSRLKVSGPDDWKAFEKLMTQGAAAFRLFKHDTTI